MSEEQSQWTVDTLKALHDTTFRENDKRYEQRFQSQERALIEARLANEKRLDGMNEFRQALTDASGKYITRTEALAMVLAACTITGTIVAVVTFFMRK